MNSIWKTDQSYPYLLSKADGAPPKLYWQGQPLRQDDSYFSIVGTRRPSPYGRQIAEEFAGELASRGFVIVSGLAYGIDQIAHEATLAAGGRTIAVLGSGFDHLAFHHNRELAEKILETGSLITQFEPSIRPNKTTFPQRNVVIAGISCATLVVEAPEKSGALITARLAVEYGRDVFAIPGNITQATSKGTNALIRDGCAHPTTCVQDIFNYMELAHKSQIPATPVKGRIKFNGALHIPNLSGDEKIIYELLQKSSRMIDEIVAETKLPASKIGTAISLLELKGLVEISGSYVLITR